MYPQILSLILHDKRFLLLDRDCSKRTDLFYYQSPKKKELFQRACEIGKIDIVKSLFPYIDPSADNNCAIRLASFYGQTEVVKILLQDSRVDPSADNNLAIQWASKYGHHEVVKILLQDSRVDPSADNDWAIRKASQNGHHEVVKILLLDKRVDPSAKDNFAIRWASQNDHHKVVKILLANQKVNHKLNWFKKIYYNYFY